MTVERMIELLEIEKECVLRNASGECNRYCAGCDLLQDDTELHEMYTDALALLKAQEPVEPTAKNGAYFCGNPHCRKIIAQMVPCGAPTHRVKYCSECGRKVKWE